MSQTTRATNTPDTPNSGPVDKRKVSDADAAKALGFPVYLVTIMRKPYIYALGVMIGLWIGRAVYEHSPLYHPAVVEPTCTHSVRCI